MRKIEKVAQANLAAITEDPRPGQGVVMGLNETGDTALQAHWLVASDGTPRNRVLEEAARGWTLRAKAYDETTGEVNPQATIYNAMRETMGVHIVSNGRQTDTLARGYAAGQAFATTLAGVGYGPGPNHEARISGMVVPYSRQIQSDVAEYGFYVVRRDSDSDDATRTYSRGALSLEEKGVGRAVRTETGDSGLPDESEGKPFLVPLGKGAEDTAWVLWNSLDQRDRVALAVKSVHLATGQMNYSVIDARHDSHLF